MKTAGGVTYICVGSVGLPFDGTPRSYAVLNEDGVKLVSFEGEELASVPFD